MDQIPKRTGLAGLYRGVLNRMEKHLLFPLQNPSHYQLIGLVLSVAYLFQPQTTIQILLVAAILILDWMDGAVARKNKLANKEGWMTDVAVDRISEGLIFIAHLFSPLANTFFLLYLANIWLSIYSVKSGKHLILPLRFVWMVILILQLWIF